MKIFSRFYVHNNRKVYYKLSQPTESKRKNNLCLVFLHPFLMNHNVWKYQWHVLGHDYPMVSLDIPPFGFSEFRSQDNITVEFYQDLVVNLIEHLKIKEVLFVGNSLGGGICLAASVLLKEKVRGLFLISPLYCYALNRNLFLNLFLKILKLPGMYVGINYVVKSLHFRIISSIFYREPSFKLLNKTETDFLNNIEKLIANKQTVYAMVNLLKNLSTWETIEKSYRSINVPVYLCWGEEDTILPVDMGRILLKRIKNADFISFKKVGHMAQIEVPEAINRLLLNFVKSVEGVATVNI